VGFLNEDTQADRAAFAAQYDVVIENNGDFGYVNDLLSSWILGW
jgi:hypothetical protein